MKYLQQVGLLAMVILVACTGGSDTPPLEPQSVTFRYLSTGTTNSSGRIDQEATPHSLVVSIETEAGQSVHHRLSVNLLSFNGEYLSEPVPLTPGNYTVTEFLVLDDLGNTLFAAPVAGSPNALLVDQPLPQPFTVAEGLTTEVLVEVLSAEEGTPDDFGYASLKFTVRPTFNFQIVVFAINETTALPELVASDLTVVVDGTERVNTTLEASTNLIRVPDSAGSYSLTVSKVGYPGFSGSYSARALKTHAPGNAPLQIILGDTTVVDTDTTNADWVPGDPWVDARDGQVYGTVQIGNQVWMTRNLNYGRQVPIGSMDTEDTFDDLDEKYCLDSTCAEGGFYSWWELAQTDSYLDAATDSTEVRLQGLCPESWHVPTEAEWREATGTSQGPVRDAPNLLDVDANQPLGANGGTNLFAFNLRVYGYVAPNSTPFLTAYGVNAHLWTATTRGLGVFGAPSFRYVRLGAGNGYLQLNGAVGFMNCRCIKD